MSAFPERYDQVAQQAYGLLDEVLLMRWVACRPVRRGVRRLRRARRRGPGALAGPGPERLRTDARRCRAQAPEIASRGCSRRRAEVARSLEAGEIGVVGMTGVDRRAPEGARHRQRHRGSSRCVVDAGAPTAPSAKARCVTRECQPTCASGRTETIPATITLSGVRECRGRRYFESAEVRVRPTPSASSPRPTCERPVDGGAGAHDDRTSGTASERSARRTSGRPTSRRSASARARGRPASAGQTTASTSLPVPQ